MRWGTKSSKVALLIFFLLTSCQHVEFIEKPAPDRGVVIPEVNNVLLELINTQETFEISGADFDSTSLEHLITLATPAGYRLRLRYTELSIPLVEALRVSQDTELLHRLLEFAKWAKKPEVRAQALITVGSFSDPSNLEYFRMALSDKDIEIRFAAVEGLQIWGDERAKYLLKDVLRDPWSPLLQVFAAQALLSLGDASGLPFLLKKLEDPSWIVRAMAVRYLGDYADFKESSRLLRALERETRNDFVIAELATSVLKLLSRENKDVSYSPLSKGWQENDEVAYTVGKDAVIEVEPLILVPPRLHIDPATRIAQVVNNRLLTLIRNRLGQPIPEFDKSDANLETLNRLVTPTGFALQTRYSELAYMIAEGLAGAKDPILRVELANLARQNTNPLVRGTALLSLSYNSYNSKEEDIPLIQEGLTSSNSIIRFAAIEAAAMGRFKSVKPDLIQIILHDSIPVFRVFAMQALINMGDATAVSYLRGNVDDKDWPSRAMTYWYMGRYGINDDFQLLMSRLSAEKNPFVRAELALAVKRLVPIEK